MKLTQFLNDTEVMLENGFGDAKTIYKMFSALRELETVILSSNDLGYNAVGLSYILEKVDRALDES
jgi:hypothetical protein